MEIEFGMKELYDVSLKSTQNIEINGRNFEAGETIAFFDKISIANFQEFKNLRTARGGYGNETLITWITTQEISISFSQGVFSKEQFALMTNNKLISLQSQDYPVSQREVVESDENKIITLRHEPIESLFIYDKKTGVKQPIVKISSNKYQVAESYNDYIVDYKFESKGTSTLEIGRELTQGFLILEGKTRVKDDITGATHTGIITIPRLKLTSGLSMRLGRNSEPVVGNLNAMGYPIGDRWGDKKVMEIVFLENDIDSDL